MKVFTPPSTPSSSKKNVQSIQPERKSRRKFDFSIKTLQLYSHYRQDDAAKELGVAPITLKRICQRRKYRWPYRTIKAKLRREALAAEKLRNTERLTTRMTTPSSPSLAAPELLLSLSKERKTFNCSPTSRHRMQPPATLPQPLHQLNYKSSFYSASFHAAAPTFPMRTTLRFKEHGKTLQPLLEHEQPHYANI
ncbi:uncharacterized protein PITG_16842 [Phytophthora infestans T30-4]|uniref:RWP-RK domain-containing protein n=1 Tax=Phytophthora infestans (strain T30-4) TaxID=403677 RepID=D0NU85_PHYIT|nr:uncharacterized protein PITG_16842 [Phytophthora infestans T30-4]EEY65218.1 conserved hypothetical protein [Phytophthora infestans T30-4]|eukprot:XP_002897282.1 conserved hypothetical protein [Phytophthora infestans T30-4]